VESSRTAQWLREVGCDRAQGYLWSRPVPWTELVPAPALPRPRPTDVLCPGGTP